MKERAEKILEQNSDVALRFLTFCKLVGKGNEARDLKLRFANHAGVPRML